MPPLLILFALGNLVVGSAAFVVSALVEPIAADLGTSKAAVGQAMTVYSLVTALAVPVFVAATAHWPRRRVLMLALALFTLGNLLCTLAPDLATLLGGRAVMGLGSMYTPLAAAVALVLVAPERRGQALSFVFLGMSLSYVVGVPIGAWIGLNQGWHAALAVMTGASALLLVAVAIAVPRDVRSPAPALSGLKDVLRQGPVLAVLATTLLYFSAIFTVFSYIGPVLKALAPMDPARLSLTLTLFGLAGVAGTLIGGAAADRVGPATTMKLLLPLLALTMAILPLTEGHYIAMLAVMLVWGMAGFGMMAPQQSTLAQLAPAQASLLLSLNSSMLYLGTALGAVVGGIAGSSIGFARLAWAGAPFALLALVFVLGRSRPSAAQPQAAD